MKKTFLYLAAFFCGAAPILAGIRLSPEPTNRAVKEYLEFCRTGHPDKPVVWKVYVFGEMMTAGMGQQYPEEFKATLTPNSADPNKVFIQADRLGQVLKAYPKIGDALIVKGRLHVVRTDPLMSVASSEPPKLYLDVDKAILLPQKDSVSLNGLKIPAGAGSW